MTSSLQSADTLQPGTRASTYLGSDPKPSTGRLRLHDWHPLLASQHHYFTQREASQSGDRAVERWQPWEACRGWA